MKHNVMVDVSGRMEKSNSKDAVLAFSNDGFEAAILISGKVKLEVNRTLAYFGSPRRKRGVQVLVAGLYLLLKDYLDQLDHIVIDDELPGWGKEIKRQLLLLIWQERPHFSRSKLNVSRIGEHSRADNLARLVRKKKTAPNKKISYRNLMAVLSRTSS